MHASCVEHSLLLTHSGLQFGGLPINSGKQEQEYALFTTSHLLLSPHGDGTQGLMGIGDSIAVRKNKKYNVFLTINTSNTTDQLLLLNYSRLGIH